MMGRIYGRVHRLLRLVCAIQSSGKLTAPDLARLCEVHQRTIYRDLAALNLAGIPCGYDRSTGGYRVGRGFFMPPVELTFEEALAVVALLENVGDGEQIPFLGAATRVAEKLKCQLPASVLDDITAVEPHVEVDLARSAADDSCRDVYDQMRQAITRRRVVYCTYESAGAGGADLEPASFELRPFVLWFAQRAWYVVGHHSGRNAVRKLKLNRFTSVQSTDRPFVIPKDFDLRADLGNAWRMIRGGTRYAVAVQFEPSFADTASETRWHPTQVEEWDADTGRVTLRFEIDGLEEIVWWVLGYGPFAKVLEPPELAARVAQLARETCSNYP